MLTYKQFEKYMSAIVAADKKLDEIFKVLGGGDGIFDCTAIGTAVELISLLMEDSEDWIYFWVYETNCGEDWTDETASEADGTPIICKTIRQLYDFLVQNGKNSKPLDHMKRLLGKTAETLPIDKQEKLKNAMKDYCEVCDYINHQLVGQQPQT